MTNYLIYDNILINMFCIFIKCNWGRRDEEKYYRFKLGEYHRISP